MYSGAWVFLFVCCLFSFLDLSREISGLEGASQPFPGVCTLQAQLSEAPHDPGEPLDP